MGPGRPLLSALIAGLFLCATLAAGAERDCGSNLRKGPLWALLNFFSTPASLKNAESVRIAMEGQGTVRGKLIVGRPNGSPIERYAYQIERKTGHRVLLSTGLNDDRRVEGFVSGSMSVMRASGDEKMAIVSLRAKEARGALSLVPAHEGTHAWLDFLDRMGEGTPLSIGFQDLGGNYTGPYSLWMSAQELKTWSQDVVRVLRKDSESSIQSRFRGGGRLPRRELFANLDESISKAEILQRLSARAETDLADAKAAIGALEGSATEAGAAERWADALFEKDARGEWALKPKFQLKLGKERTVLIPMNTKAEWELALAIRAGDDAPAAIAKLLAIWQRKVEWLSDFGRGMTMMTEDVLKLLNEVKSAKDFDAAGYAEVRRRLAAYGNFSSTAK